MSSVGGTSEPSNLTGSNKQTPNRKETFKQPNSTVPQGVEQNPPNHQYSKKTATKPSYEPVKIAYISYEKKATEKVTNVKLITHSSADIIIIINVLYKLMCDFFPNLYIDRK